MKKILFIIPTLTQTNGVTSFLLNYLSNFNYNDYSVEVVFDDLRTSSSHEKTLQDLNIKYYKLPYIKNVGLKNYYFEVNNFFKAHHDYDLIYSNVSYKSLIYFHIAKKYKLKKFAIHAHATQISDNFIRKNIGKIIQKKVNKMAKYKFACSKLAGEALFGNLKFKIINNAIDYNKFQFNDEYRKSIRSQYEILKNEKIIGFVGRFVNQKNVFFFINLIQKLPVDYKVMMIGTGSLKNEFIRKAKERGILDRFIFIDEINTVYRFYSSFDYFLLPSHFEGLPIVGVEAQVNGIPCLFSNTISNECKISSNTVYLDRNDIDIWIKKIKLMTRDKNVNLDDHFNIEKQAKIFEKILNDILHSK